MMCMKTKTTGLSPVNGSSGANADAGGKWEMRPGGMLVQKRTDSEQNRTPPPTIRVRVKHGSTYHEIYISAQATFGELKKMLCGPTGLHQEDQKLLFKHKERDSKAFLDMAGVRDRSKLELIEDLVSKEKRYLEMQKNAKMEKASISISEISLEVDRLARQVSDAEAVISKGEKVVEKDVLNLIELLMHQMVKLDGIILDGDLKLQREIQERRVQKYVETLDMLKIKNSMLTSKHTKITERQSQFHQQQQQRYSNGKIPSSNQQKQVGHSVGKFSLRQPLQHTSRNSKSESVVITTQWETFDSGPALVPATPSTNTVNLVHPMFNWDLL